MHFRFSAAVFISFSSPGFRCWFSVLPHLVFNLSAMISIASEFALTWGNPLKIVFTASPIWCQIPHVVCKQPFLSNRHPLLGPMTRFCRRIMLIFLYISFVMWSCGSMDSLDGTLIKHAILNLSKPFMLFVFIRPQQLESPSWLKSNFLPNWQKIFLTFVDCRGFVRYYIGYYRGIGCQVWK